MTTLDHKAQAYQLALGQYKSAPNLIGFINAFLDVSQDIENNAQDLFNKFDLDLASGDFLDAIGQLLAIPRFPVTGPDQFFQLDVTPLDMNYRFFDGIGTPFDQIDDLHYRRALKAWTVTMNSVGSVNELILSLSYLFGVPVNLITIGTIKRFQFDVTPLDSGYALDWNYTEININVNAVLDSIDLSMYNYITPSTSRLWPKVAGIKYTLTHL